MSGLSEIATLEDTLAFMLFRRLCLSLATKMRSAQTVGLATSSSAAAEG
jgi:hypothetical protein